MYKDLLRSVYIHINKNCKQPAKLIVDLHVIIFYSHTDPPKKSNVLNIILSMKPP